MAGSPPITTPPPQGWIPMRPPLLRCLAGASNPQGATPPPTPPGGFLWNSTYFNNLPKFIPSLRALQPQTRAAPAGH